MNKCGGHIESLFEGQGKAEELRSPSVRRPQSCGAQQFFKGLLLLLTWCPYPRPSFLSSPPSLLLLFLPLLLLLLQIVLNLAASAQLHPAATDWGQVSGKFEVKFANSSKSFPSIAVLHFIKVFVSSAKSPGSYDGPKNIRIRQLFEIFGSFTPHCHSTRSRSLQHDHCKSEQLRTTHAIHVTHKGRIALCKYI